MAEYPLQIKVTADTAAAQAALSRMSMPSGGSSSTRRDDAGRYTSTASAALSAPVGQSSSSIPSDQTSAAFNTIAAAASRLSSAIDAAAKSMMAASGAIAATARSGHGIWDSIKAGMTAGVGTAVKFAMQVVVMYGLREGASYAMKRIADATAKMIESGKGGAATVKIGAVANHLGAAFGGSGGGNGGGMPIPSPAAAASSITKAVSAPAEAAAKTGSKIMSVVGTVLKSAAMIGGGLLLIGGPIAIAAMAVTSVLGTITGGLVDAFGQMAGMILDLPKQILLAVGAMAAAVVGGIYALHKLMGPAAQNESFKAQLSNMGKAGNLDFYTELASKGPQSLGEVVKGGITMESFGIDSKKYLQSAQDSASMFKVPIEEVAGILSRVKAGQVEQESMNRVGITKADLKGIRFDAQGSVNKEDSSKVFDAFVKAMQTRSGGMSETMSNTYEGKVSNLGDAINTMLVKAFGSLTAYAAQWLSPVIGMVDGIGAKLALIDWTPMGEAVGNVVDKATAFVSGIDWKGWGQSILGMFTGAADIVGKLFSADGRQELMDTFNGWIPKIESVFASAWQGLKNVFADVIPLFGALISAAASALSLPSIGLSMFEGALSMMGSLLKNIITGAMAWADAFITKTEWIFESSASKLVNKLTLGAVEYVMNDSSKQYDDMRKNTLNAGGTKADVALNLLAQSKDRIDKQLGITPEAVRYEQQDTVKDIVDRMLKNTIDTAKAMKGNATADTRTQEEKVKNKAEEDKRTAQAALMAPLTTDSDIKSAVASNALEALAMAGKGVTGSTSLAEAEAAKAAAQPAMDAARRELDKLKSSFATEEAQRAAIGVSQFTQSSEKQNHAMTLLNDENAIKGTESAMANKIQQLKDAAAAIAKEQAAYMLATNKLLAGMLAEIKSMNDYSQSDVATSFFA